MGLFILLTGCTTASVEQQESDAGSGATTGGDRIAGARDFAANCAVCHGSNGDGGAIGISLRHEFNRMDFGTLASWIEDPEPPMPRLFPKFLDKQEVRDLAAYVESL
jgi:mono/diheme cytochrome c family protein